MKKIYSALIVISVLAISITAEASISINMKKTLNIWADSSGTVLPIGSLVQMVWSADNLYATPTGGSIPTTGGQYADNDFVIYSATTTATSGWSGDFDGSATYNNSAVGGATINSGYVYAFVFQNGTPLAGDWYARSAMITGLGDASLPTPPQPDSLDVSPNGNRMIVHPSTGGFQVQTVPEPSSFALLGIGLGLIAVRKRFISK